MLFIVFLLENDHLKNMTKRLQKNWCIWIFFLISTKSTNQISNDNSEDFSVVKITDVTPQQNNDVTHQQKEVTSYQNNDVTRQQNNDVTHQPREDGTERQFTSRQRDDVTRVQSDYVTEQNVPVTRQQNEDVTNHAEKIRHVNEGQKITAGQEGVLDINISNVTTSTVNYKHTSSENYYSDNATINGTNLKQISTKNTLGKYISYVITPIFITTGIFGNALTVAVMTNKAFSSMTMSLILTALSVSDTTVLLMQPFTKPSVIRLLGKDIRSLNDASCKIFFVILRTAKMASSWFIVLVCLERFIAVWLPLKAKVINSKRNALVSMGIIITALLTLNGFWSFSSKIVDNICYAHRAAASIKAKMITVTGSITYGAAPTLILSIMTPLIIFRIVQTSKQRQKMTAATSLKQPANQKTITMLLAVTVAYVLLAIPISLVFILTVTSGEKPYLSMNTPLSLVREIAQMLELLNYSVNFYLYVVCSRVFRGRVIEILCCKNRKK